MGVDMPTAHTIALRVVERGALAARESGTDGVNLSVDGAASVASSPGR